jgi:hypothetical protein
MINLRKGLAALAVGLTVTAMASPSYAQEGRFQISRERAQAIHQCNLPGDTPNRLRKARAKELSES